MLNPANELFEAANRAASQFRAMHDVVKGPQQAAWDDFNVERAKVQDLVQALGMKSLSSDVLVEMKYATEKLHSISVRLELDLLERQQKHRDKEAKEDADRAAALRKELP